LEAGRQVLLPAYRQPGRGTIKKEIPSREAPSFNFMTYEDVTPLVLQNAAAVLKGEGYC